MADQAINALSTKTAPETSDQLLLVGAGEPQLIDYDKLADAILNKITSKNYALDAGQMTLLAALNKLNSESFHEFNGNIDLLSDQYIVASTADSKGSLPTELVGNRYIIIGDTLLTDTGLQYGVQFAFSFGSSKIAIRNCNFNSNNVGKYSDWRYI